MDIAYDHIQEEVLSPEEAARKEEEGERERKGNLNTEFQEAYKSFTASPWGAKLGGFFSDVKKQGETFYDGARQEASAAGEEAFKGFSGLRESLVSRARSMSTGQGSSETHTATNAAEASKDADSKERSQSETLRESESVVSRFRAEAAKRLKDLERAEEAADAAIFKFGANIGNFLKDAVSIAPPSEEVNKDGSRQILFESRDQDGKRVIHSTRFDAQLHAIHSSHDSFVKDPISPEYESWKDEFDVEKKTDAIAKDLEKYEELRRAMEKLVPEEVEYSQFWLRYYFLRMVVETDEERRREILKGATQSTDETVGWDDDSDDEQSSTPQQSQPHSSNNAPAAVASQSSSTTINPSEANQSLKPTQHRRSQDENSQPGSDASYDLVSGATSRAPGSPKETRGKKDDDDEEEDWE